eukprot:TRINITY_DN29279_c0_g2_i1.p1 TRINITY_DN29279_c0_g2~~TRINITY_DN29279_c0_g2_i1.p1  ORF type:complete len:446 (+),score=67.64 TRINITY_DN29279_c0_g2_i1:54-1340(+)
MALKEVGIFIDLDEPIEEQQQQKRTVRIISSRISCRSSLRSSIQKKETSPDRRRDDPSPSSSPSNSPSRRRRSTHSASSNNDDSPMRRRHSNASNSSALAQLAGMAGLYGQSEKTDISLSTAHDSRIDPRHGLNGPNLEVEQAKLTDKYECVRNLGMGAFGCVGLFRLRTDYSQRFAVKTIPFENLKDASLFEKELQIAHLLNHPNIVTLHAVLEEDHAYHLIMEHCDGGDLLSYVNKKSAKEVLPKIAGSLFHQMLSGLAYLHHYRMAHRDVKPQNYIMTKIVDSETIPIMKLIDFGASRSTLEEDGLMWTQIGTWQFAAPEVFVGDGYTKSCDMWSLGCTLFAMCNREMPFNVDDEQTFVDNLVAKRLTPNWKAKGWLRHDKRLKQIARRLLQNDTNARPTALKLLDDQPWLYNGGASQQQCCSVQ